LAGPFFTIGWKPKMVDRKPPEAHRKRRTIIRLAIVILIISALTGVAVASDLGNQAPTKNSNPNPYIEPAVLKQGGDTIFGDTVISGLHFSDTGTDLPPLPPL
jgi:hypothetical protein